MKSKWLLFVLAPLLSLSAAAQIAKERPAVAEDPDAGLKWKAFVGFGYTSLNQVNGSRNGVSGVDLSVTRNFGKYFGVTAQGGHYAYTITSNNDIVGNPSVDQYLAGPEVHAKITGSVSAFAHLLVGGVHTGNVSINPSTSFAGGPGMGLDYWLTHRLGLRTYGDDIFSSFTLVPYEPGYSTHRRANAHAAIGVVYKF